MLARRPCGVTVLGGRYLLADDRIYAPFVMSLPPQTMRPFNALFRSLLAESLPWRASVLLTGDGLSGQSLRLTAASILSFLSASNRMYRKSMRELQALAQNGEPSVLFQMCFVTWTDRLAYPPGEEGLSRALSALSRRQARLMTAVQSWGSSDTSAFTGDPLSLYAATLPAMSCSSPAPKACAPLDDAVRLLPFARPCSPWKNCDLPLRTSDGRFMPLALLSPGMASWNEICFAGMGAGKSFFLNTLNFFFILRPGQVKLPWLTVIDIGMSSSGVISLIRAALPPEKRGPACAIPARPQSMSLTRPSAVRIPSRTTRTSSSISCLSCARRSMRRLPATASPICSGRPWTPPTAGFRPTGTRPAASTRSAIPMSPAGSRNAA